MDEISLLKETVKNQESEITYLKNQIQLLKDKENSYQQSISNIKKIQSEYENSYMESINDYKEHEKEIKEKYLDYQKLLETQNKANEKRLTTEIDLLKKQLKEKENIINGLQNNLNILNDQITKDEINYHFKIKEFEDVIISKDRKLNELKQAIKEITNDATIEINRLSDQLEELQFKNRNNNIINYYDKNTNNNLNSNGSDEKVRKSINLSVYANYSNDELINEIYLLQNENNNLLNTLREKENEVNFWKNLRNDLARTNNHSDNLNNNFDILNKMKLQNYEKSLLNMETKINDLKNRFSNSFMRKSNPNNSQMIEINRKYYINTSDILDKDYRNEELNDDLDQNEGDKENKSCLNVLPSLNIAIPNEEGIRNEFINSQVSRIKNLESNNSNE